MAQQVWDFFCCTSQCWTETHHAQNAERRNACVPHWRLEKLVAMCNKTLKETHGTNEMTRRVLVFTWYRALYEEEKEEKRLAGEVSHSKQILMAEDFSSGSPSPPPPRLQAVWAPTAQDETPLSFLTPLVGMLSPGWNFSVLEKVRSPSPAVDPRTSFNDISTLFLSSHSAVLLCRDNRHGEPKIWRCTRVGA